MREGCKSSGASEAWGSGTGERWRGEFPTRVGRRGEGVESDRWGRLAVTEGEGVIAGLCKLKVETTFGNYAKATQAGMGRAYACGGLQCGAGQHG
jgi:hypothetical protein